MYVNILDKVNIQSDGQCTHLQRWQKSLQLSAFAIQYRPDKIDNTCQNQQSIEQHNPLLYYHR